MQPLAAGRYERRAWRRQLRTVSLWTRSRVVVLCFRPVRLTISLPPSLSRSLSRWDDKTETSWPGPIRDALQSRILFTGARCPNKFLLFLIGSERNGSHRVGTGNSYRTQLIRLLNVAALLLLLLLFVLLLLVPIANSYPRVFWQISINVLLSHKSINYLFSDTKKNFINISTTYDSYFRCGIFGKLGETQETERTCKQNKTREEKRRDKSEAASSYWSTSSLARCFVYLSRSRQLTVLYSAFLYSSFVPRFIRVAWAKQTAKMTMQREVGVQDFVLLDQVNMEKFMDNLRKR